MQRPCMQHTLHWAGCQPTNPTSLAGIPSAPLALATTTQLRFDCGAAPHRAEVILWLQQSLFGLTRLDSLHDVKNDVQSPDAFHAEGNAEYTGKESMIAGSSYDPGCLGCKPMCI